MRFSLGLKKKKQADRGVCGTNVACFFYFHWSFDMVVTVVEAGRLGGLAVLRKRGREFYSFIGRQGQAAMRKKYPRMARVWGKMGGRPRKPSLSLIMGDKGQKNEKEVADPPQVSALLPHHKSKRFVF